MKPVPETTTDILSKAYPLGLEGDLQIATSVALALERLEASPTATR